MNEIKWVAPLLPGNDVRSRGYYEGGSFVIRFFRTVSDNSISLRHNDEFVGSFKTVGAAKRKALQIVRRRTPQP